MAYLEVIGIGECSGGLGLLARKALGVSYGHVVGVLVGGGRC